MNIAADKISCKALDVTGAEIRIEQDKKNWVEYSQLIAGVMSKRMAELGFTQLMLAEKMNCTQQYISKILKGKKEYVTGDYMQNRECIRHRDYQKSK